MPENVSAIASIEIFCLHKCFYHVESENQDGKADEKPDKPSLLQSLSLQYLLNSGLLWGTHSPLILRRCGITSINLSICILSTHLRILEELLSCPFVPITTFLPSPYHYLLVPHTLCTIHLRVCFEGQGRLWLSLGLFICTCVLGATWEEVDVGGLLEEGELMLAQSLQLEL